MKEDIDCFCCRCMNLITSVNGVTSYLGSWYCMDCWEEIAPEEFKKVVADLMEERGEKK